MANVTFMIGNGFDLQMGLKTRYADFYNQYTEIKPTDNDLIQRFKKSILRDEAHGWVNWADFEIGMGKQSKLFCGETPTEDFIKCFDDFAVCFNKYLLNESARINWDAVDVTICKPFNLSIRSFYTHIASVSRDAVKKRISHQSTSEAQVNFLQFNYTDIFDKLLAKSSLSAVLSQLTGIHKYEINKLGVNLHIHGQMNNGYPAIGVNDESQIENELIRNDPRIQKVFVKPKFLDALQTRNVNQPIPRVAALNAISESTVICAFGASIGETDKYWWKKIGELLISSDRVLIIFDVCGSADDGVSPLAFLNSEVTTDERRTDILNRFIRLADWGEEDIEKTRIK